MFHSLATDPQSIYYDLIHQYKKFFFDSTYGLLIVHQGQIINGNPTLLKMLDCHSPKNFLGNSLSTCLESPVKNQMVAHTCCWKTTLGHKKDLETLSIDFNMNEDTFTAFLIAEKNTNMTSLEAIAKQLSLIFQESYRPVLIFDAANPQSHNLLGENPAASHFFDLLHEKDFRLSKVIHEKDCDGYLAYAEQIYEHGSSQYAFQLQRKNHYSHDVRIQNYALSDGPEPKVLSLFRDNLYHYGLDEKTRFNYKRLQDYFSVTPHAMAIVDKNFVIREVNLGFSHQFKYADEEVVGQSICTLISSPCEDQCLHSENTEKIYDFADRYGNKSPMRIHDIPLFLEDEYIGNYLLFSEAYLPIPLDIKQLKDDLFNLTPEHVVLLDEKFELVWSNINYSTFAAQIPN